MWYNPNPSLCAFATACAGACCWACSVIESAKKRKSRAGAADDDMTILTMQLADDKSILD
jgi:hypothetical protein